MTEPIRTPFGRLGNKYYMRKIIEKYIPPHRIYIEPFVGSGAIFFHKAPAEKSILNDLDKNIVSGFRLLKTVSTDPQKFNIVRGLENIQRFVDSPHHTKEDKLLKILHLQTNTFGSKGIGKIYKTADQERKIKKLPLYKEKLKNAIIRQSDYKNLLQQYNSKDAFWFLDPPYQGSVKDRLYKDNELNLVELNEFLGKIKGKFLLTINDNLSTRKIFARWKKRGYTVMTNTHGQSALGGSHRKELLIFN